MKQLIINDIFDLVNELTRKGMNFEDVMNLPLYLGNDNELNGIHNAWFCQLVDKNDNNEDMQYLVDMINEDFGTTELKDKGILIS